MEEADCQYLIEVKKLLKRFYICQLWNDCSQFHSIRIYVLPAVKKVDYTIRRNRNMMTGNGREGESAAEEVQSKCG